MKNSLESEMVIDGIIKTCAENGIGEDGLNGALLSMLYTSMMAAQKFEHNLCDGDGQLLMVIKRYT